MSHGWKDKINFDSLITEVIHVFVVNMEWTCISPGLVWLWCGPPAQPFVMSHGKMDETLKTKQFPGLIQGRGKEW